MKTWVTQLRKGLLEYCVLNVLEHGEDYGYEIVLKLKTLSEMDVTESTVYPILARLKGDGYLKVRTEPSSSGPPRRYFSLTSLGRVRVKAMNEYWDALHRSIKSIRNGKPSGDTR